MRSRFGEFVLDSDARELLRADEPVHLTPKAFQLLEALIRERPRAVSKQELYDLIWPKTFVDDSNLKSLVAEIRRAIDSGSAPSFIRTVNRVGYAFNGDAQSAGPRARGYRLFGNGLRLSFREEAVIGRHPECEVWIDSPDISRQHARLTMTAETVVIEDLKSKNGTFVGNERIAAPRQLQDGDRIRVADVTLIFRTGAGDDSTASAEP